MNFQSELLETCLNNIKCLNDIKDYLYSNDRSEENSALLKDIEGNRFQFAEYYVFKLISFLVVVLEKWQRLSPDLDQKKKLTKMLFGLYDGVNEIEKQLLSIEASCQTKRFADISCLKMKIEELEV